MASSVSSRPVGIARSGPPARVSVWRTAYEDDELQAPPERSLKPLVAVAPECQVDSDSDAVALLLVAPGERSSVEVVSPSAPERPPPSSATRSLAACSRRARSRSL